MEVGKPPPSPEPMNTPRWRMIALGFVFLWFFVGGIAHFAATSFEMTIVPGLEQQVFLDLMTVYASLVAGLEQGNFFGGRGLLRTGLQNMGSG